MMTPPSAELTTALDALVAPRRRYLLATLLERDGEPSAGRPSTSERLSIETLATEVASVEHDFPIVTDDQCEHVHVDLIHVHVPRLVDADLLSRHDDDATTVSLTDHPVLESAWVRSLLADPTGESLPVDEATLDRTLEALRSPRRRAVCAALARRRGDVSVADLAAAVVAREGGDEMQLVDVTESACTDVAASLVHEHLPALSNAGLVEYDGESTRAALATDAPQWRIDWVAEGPLADVADLVRHPTARGRQSASDGTAAGAPSADADASGTNESTGDEFLADAPAATTTAADDGRLLWTLARPRSGRASDGSASSHDTGSLDEPSTATDPPDGPPT